MYATFLAIMTVFANPAKPVEATPDPSVGAEAKPAHASDNKGQGGWQPPFVLEVRGPASPKPGEAIRLRIEIERNFVEETPLTISLGLPEGVSLVDGELEERIVDAESKTIQREFVLQLGAEIPGEELTVTVEQRGKGWGAHSVKTYEFGRVRASTLDAELRRGEPVDLGGGRIVRPVLVD